MTTTTQKTIKVENAGPIQKAEFNIDDYGVTVLTGPNGAGKSFLLDAAQKAAAGRGKINIRDGQRRGMVDMFGAVITLGASTRHKGAFEVQSLEGRFDLATLVDPQMKDPATSDGRRIKALVGLTGLKADPKLFRDRGEFSDFDEVVNPSSLEGDDLCEMASRIKRDYDSAARTKEQEADREDNNAVACEARVADVDFSIDIDVEEARKLHGEALAKLSSLESRKASDDQHRAHIDQAKQRLAAIKANREENEIEKLEARLVNESNYVITAQERVAELADQLNAARDNARQAVADRNATAKDLRTAKERAEEIDSLEEIINGDMALPVTDEELQAAREAIEVGQQRYDSARGLQDAKRDRDTGKDHRDRATRLKAKAQDLRDTGRATDDVLSDAIKCDRLKVVTEDGKVRLMTDHPKRGQNVPYHDLSEGERWKIAIDLGADQVGEGGLLVIPQVAWESLDVFTRPQVHEHAVQRKVYVLTAEATREAEDGTDIVAKRYDSSL